MVKIVHVVRAHNVMRNSRLDRNAGGVRGSSTFALSDVERNPERRPLGRTACFDADTDSLAVLYAALCSLLILGDDLGRVNRSACLAAVKEYQHCDGR